MHRCSIPSVLRRSALGLVLTGTLASASGAAPLALLNGRFSVEAHWSANGQANVPATPLPLTGNTGYFTFFDPSNVEIIVKVLDACQTASPRFWVFAAGLTNVDVTLDVVDTWSGERRTFHNPAGHPFAPLQRTDLFATCGTPQPCGHGNAADLAASPRADDDAEKLALTLDGGVAATTATYDRVRADLAAIVAGAPGLGNHSFLERYDTQSLIVALDTDTSHFPGGPDWECLNRWYGVTSIRPLFANYKVLEFRPRLNVAPVADDYRAVPGITYVELNGLIRIGEFPYLDLCALHGSGNALVYYFTGATPTPRQFRSQPGKAPVEEPFDSSASAGCAAFTAQ